jgi:hypothetical protein
MNEKIKKEIEKTRLVDMERREKAKLRAFIYGYPGTGKTYSLRTWPWSNDSKMNMHIDSFDPSGTKCMLEYVEKGKCVVDSSFEGDDYENPFAFAEWSRAFSRRCKMGYFDEIDIYALDSGSEFFESIANHVIADGMEKEKYPRNFWGFADDHGREMMRYQKIVVNVIRKILKLNVNFIMTGHTQHKESRFDAKAGKHVGMIQKQTEYQTFEALGQLSVKISRLFDEIWITKPSYGKNDIIKVEFDRRMGVTKNSRSRNAAVYDLPAVLPADFSQIMEMISD